jgi:hypothetical protein
MLGDAELLWESAISEKATMEELIQAQENALC